MNTEDQHYFAPPWKKLNSYMVKDVDKQRAKKLGQ